MVEYQIVILGVAGSSPVGHPTPRGQESPAKPDKYRLYGYLPLFSKGAVMCRFRGKFVTHCHADRRDFAVGRSFAQQLFARQIACKMFFDTCRNRKKSCRIPPSSRERLRFDKKLAVYELTT